MLQRSAAALALVAMLMAGAAPCVGLEASAATHHDCCMDPNCPESRAPMAGHVMASPAAADDCCAMSEDRAPRQAALLAVPFVAAPPLGVLDVLPHASPVDLPRLPPRPLPTDLHAAPLYLLFSVFLI